MIIILEGPDGSGKTTLAKQLMARFKLEYHHEGVPPSYLSALDHYGRVLHDLRDKNVVLDRYAQGERVYGPIVRGEDRLGLNGWKLIKRLISSVQAVEVLCLPSYDVCRRAWASGRIELLQSEVGFRQSYNAYSEQFHPQQYSYDYTAHNSFQRLCDFLRDTVAIKRLTPPLPAHLVGSPTASYLFVGEKGSNINAHVDLPFWGTTGSSQYLNYALETAGFKETELAFVNAYKVDGETRYGLYPELFPRIVALGNRALEACINDEISCDHVPHPQYWKRFHSKEFYKYVAMLEALRC